MKCKLESKSKPNSLNSSKLKYDKRGIGERNDRNRYEGEASTYEAHYEDKAEYTTTKVTR
jgi:hypothetical protein